MKWAFTDESRRKPHMLMAAVIVDTHAVADARQEIARRSAPETAAAAHDQMSGRIGATRSSTSSLRCRSTASPSSP